MPPGRALVARRERAADHRPSDPVPHGAPGRRALGRPGGRPRPGCGRPAAAAPGPGSAPAGPSEPTAEPQGPCPRVGRSRDRLLAPPFPRPPRWVRHALEICGRPSCPGSSHRPSGCSTGRGTRRLLSPGAPGLWSWMDDVAGLAQLHLRLADHARRPFLLAGPPGIWSRSWQSSRACGPPAADATVPHPMEEWQRYALPGFYARMKERQGMGCPPGRHVDWPARSWDADYRTPSAVAERRRRFDADTGDQPLAAHRRGRTGRNEGAVS